MMNNFYFKFDPPMASKVTATELDMYGILRNIGIANERRTHGTRKTLEFNSLIMLSALSNFFLSFTSNCLFTTL